MWVVAIFFFFCWKVYFMQIRRQRKSIVNTAIQIESDLIQSTSWIVESVNTVVQVDQIQSNLILILRGVDYSHYSKMGYTPAAEPARIPCPHFRRMPWDGTSSAFSSSFDCDAELSQAPSNFHLQLLFTCVFASWFFRTSNRRLAHCLAQGF